MAFAVLSLPVFMVGLNLKVDSLLGLGAVKVALAVLASVKLTGFPLTSFHEYEVMLPRLLPPSEAIKVPLYCFIWTCIGYKRAIGICSISIS
jgi:hypothetical protein